MYVVDMQLGNASYNYNYGCVHATAKICSTNYVYIYVVDKKFTCMTGKQLQHLHDEYRMLQDHLDQ